MRDYKRTEHQQKIVNGMETVYEKLIEFKKRANSELVVMKDSQIVRIKP